MCHYLADGAQWEDSRPPAVDDDDCEPADIAALKAENRTLKSAIAAFNSEIIYHLPCCYIFSAQSVTLCCSNQCLMLSVHFLLAD